MKKLLSGLYLFLNITVTTTMVVSCSEDKNAKEQRKILLNIVNPERGWPPATENYLSVWNSNLKRTSEQLAYVLDDMTIIYRECYKELFYQYYKGMDTVVDETTDPYGVPKHLLAASLEQHLYNSFDIQKYAAYSLKQYFIEMNINKIRMPEVDKYWINEDEIYNIYSMYYWRGISLYDWSKIYIPETGENLEFAIDINFYDYYNAAYIDPYARTCDWSSVGGDNHYYDFTGTLPKDRNDPKKGVIDSESEHMFKQKVYLDSVLYEYTDYIYRLLYPVE